MLDVACFAEAERLYMLGRDTAVRGRPLSVLVLPDVLVSGQFWAALRIPEGHHPHVSCPHGWACSTSISLEFVGAGSATLVRPCHSQGWTGLPALHQRDRGQRVSLAWWVRPAPGGRGWLSTLDPHLYAVGRPQAAAPDCTEHMGPHSGPLLGARACDCANILLACPLHPSWGGRRALLHTQGLSRQCSPFTGAPSRPACVWKRVAG